MFKPGDKIKRRVRVPVQGSRQKLRTHLRERGVEGKFVVNNMSDGSFSVELKSDQDFTSYPTEFDGFKISYRQKN